jgi:alpha-glucosidase
MWWHDAVIYQVYLRSFQDSDGDGVGDLPGVITRLEHIAGLGADAVWLSPIYPSPNQDFGYDVSDFEDVDPALGTLKDLDHLVARAHGLGLKVLLDFVPCHTSTEHRWFREHPEYYVWSDEVPNNWRAAFGGSAWGYDEQSGRYFLHSFFPEQADLDWHQPEVRERMGSALAFWRERGIDGFRLDALDRLMKDEQLRDDPPASAPPPLPMDDEDARLEHIHSRNAPGIDVALRTIRNAVGDDTLLIGEVYLPTGEMEPYLESLDVVFSFDALHSASSPDRLKDAVAAGLALGRVGWVLSNHDFSRLATRAGSENLRASILLALTLPGPAFMFQGDELGMADAHPLGEPQDRNGRDPFRAPMRWDGSRHAGFSTATPWLRTGAPGVPSVSAQEADPGSVLSLVKRTIALRRTLSPGGELLDSPGQTIAVSRGAHLIVVNLGDDPQPALDCGAAELVLEARPGDGADLSVIPAHGGWIAGSSGTASAP